MFMKGHRAPGGALGSRSEDVGRPRVGPCPCRKVRCPPPGGWVLSRATSNDSLFGRRNLGRTRFPAGAVNLDRSDFAEPKG